MEKYHCRKCHEDKPLKDMVANRCNEETHKGECRLCHGAEGKFTEFLKRLDAKPEKYSYCDCCDEMFLKCKAKPDKFSIRH